MKAILGTKLGMTQLFDANGNVSRVTLIQAGPCVVTQVKTNDVDGYEAIQLGFGKAKHQAKPQAGHLKKAGDADSRVMQEIRLGQIQDSHPRASELKAAEAEALAMKLGDTIDASVFEVGDAIQVTGTSKGKGFAGVIKRHNHSTGRKTHGSHAYRGHGSIGSGYPQHVFKGIGMAGRMGADQVTVKGMKVVAVDAENNLLAVSGAVPGPRKGLVMIKGAI
jgi:large subunit ribosomal protein L3